MAFKDIFQRFRDLATTALSNSAGELIGGPIRLSTALRAIADGSIGDLEGRFIERIFDDMRTDNRNHVIVGYRWTDDMRASHSTFSANREACRMLLREGCDGSPEAREEFERSRLCCVEIAPHYARQAVTATFLKELLTLDSFKILPREYLTPSDNPGEQDVLYRLSLWLGKRRREPESLFLESSLCSVLTYSMAKKISEVSSAIDYQDKMRFQSTSDGPYPYDRFTILSDGPLGKVIARAWMPANDIIFKSVILEDLVSDLPACIGELLGSEQKAKVLSDARSPWHVHETPSLRNLFALADMYESGSLADETMERLSRDPSKLTKPRFEEFVREMDNALRDKQERKRKKAETDARLETASRAAHPFSHATKIETEKMRFFRALLGDEAETKELRTFAKEHAELFASYKRGRLSFEDCQQVVREGRALLSQPQRTSDWSEMLRPVLRKPRQQKAEDTTERATRENPTLDERYTIKGEDARWFREWFDSLTKQEQKLVQGKLERARQGHFGDYTQIRLDRRVFEFRLFLGGAQRLFFAFPEDKVLHLLAAGVKREQNTLITRASATLDDILSNTQQ